MKKIFVIIISLFCFFNNQAQTINAELKNLINQSFIYYPKFKELAQNVVIGENKIDIIKTNRSPIINANAGYSFLDPVSKITLNGNQLQFNPHSNYSASVGGVYQLFDFGAVKQNIDKAIVELESNKHQIDAAKGQIANQITNLYYGIVYLKEAIAIQDSVLAFYAINQKDIQTKIKYGVALEYDNLTIQANIDQELNKKIDLENALQKQKNILQYFTGKNLVTNEQFDFTMPTNGVMDFLQKIQTNNIDFILQKDKINVTEADKKITALQNKPTILLNAATGFKNGIIPNYNQFRFNYIAGVSLSLPIYNGHKTKKNLQLQESIIQQQNLVLETMDSTYKKDFEQVMVDIGTAKKRIENVEGQLIQANAAKALAQIRFKNGVGTNLELINANTNVQRAALSKLQYQYQQCLAYIELARISGEKFWQ